MSRTIRRTRDKKRNKSGRSHFERDYTFDRECSEEKEFFYSADLGISWRSRPLVKLQGKAFSKAYWKFHSDTSRGYGWGNPQYSRFAFEKHCRMKNKGEIVRYYKDENHEVFAHKPACLSWER